MCLISRREHCGTSLAGTSTKGSWCSWTKACNEARTSALEGGERRHEECSVCSAGSAALASAPAPAHASALACEGRASAVEARTSWSARVQCECSASADLAGSDWGAGRVQQLFPLLRR